MQIKGTKTEKNLLTAFGGESMARNKYLFFAERARRDNEIEIAELFERMARNEEAHGRLMYQHLFGVGDSASNLMTAIDGENMEWMHIYPDFAKVAREEGFEHIASLFEHITKIEQDHEFRFLEALAKLKGADLSQPIKEKRKTVTSRGYRCEFCGVIFDERPDACEVCGAIGSFEEVTYEKSIEEL